MAVGVDQNERQSYYKVRNALESLAIGVHLDAGPAVTDSQKRFRIVLRAGNTTRNRELFRASLNDLREARAAEGLCLPQDMDGFEQAGLAAAIGAAYQIYRGARGDF